jgi:HSP20 family protein
MDGGYKTMSTIARLEPFRGLSTLQDQFNRLFNESFRNHSEESALTTWAPAVDIYETPNELVVKADLPDVSEKDIDVRVENNLLTIRGERKFEKSVSEENFLRVERTYGAFSRSFSLPNTVNAEAIGAEYKNGVLTVTLPKREESKPRQVKVTVNAANNGK